MAGPAVSGQAVLDGAVNGLVYGLLALSIVIAVFGIVKWQLNPDIYLSPLMILGTQWYILFNVIAGASAVPGEPALGSGCSTSVGIRPSVRGESRRLARLVRWPDGRGADRCARPRGPGSRAR